MIFEGKVQIIILIITESTPLLPRKRSRTERKSQIPPAKRQAVNPTDTVNIDLQDKCIGKWIFKFVEIFNCQNRQRWQTRRTPPANYAALPASMVALAWRDIKHIYLAILFKKSFKLERGGRGDRSVTALNYMDSNFPEYAPGQPRNPRMEILAKYETRWKEPNTHGWLDLWLGHNL